MTSIAYEVQFSMMVNAQVYALQKTSSVHTLVNALSTDTSGDY